MDRDLFSILSENYSLFHQGPILYFVFTFCTQHLQLTYTKFDNNNNNVIINYFLDNTLYFDLESADNDVVLRCSTVETAVVYGM